MSRSRRLAGAALGSSPAGTDRGSKLELAALGQEGDSRAAAFVALKYYRPEHQCLSEWTADELRAFSAFCRKLPQMAWQQIVETGGRHKTGLGAAIRYAPDRSAPQPAAPSLAAKLRCASHKSTVLTFNQRAANTLVYPSFHTIFQKEKTPNEKADPDCGRPAGRIIRHVR